MLEAWRTTTALLDGLFDSANQSIWREFDARYRPILMAFARRLGLNRDNAADVTQETLACFVRDYRAALSRFSPTLRMARLNDALGLARRGT